MCSLFWQVIDSPLEYASSEMSLSGGGVVNRGAELIKTLNREIDEEEVPLCSINFLQGGGASICGGIVEIGAIFYITRAVYCTTIPHACQKLLAEELPGV